MSTTETLAGARDVVRDLARSADQIEAELPRLARPEFPPPYRGTDPLEAIDHYLRELRVKQCRYEGNWHREAQIDAVEVARQRVAAALARACEKGRLR